MKSVIIKTPLGFATIIGDCNGISSISVSDEILIESNDYPQELETAVEQIQNFFNGRLTTFSLSLNPTGTPFQQKVWRELAKIPYGTTISYLDLSKKLGHPKAIRAVAAANGKNPLWIVVPCHRVIGSNGSLTGYAGGLARKKWLLQHENSAQQSLF